MPESVFTFQNKEYNFTPEKDLGISELRHIRSWYGLPLGTYNGLTNAAVMGDPDALACIIWVAQKKAGVKNVRDPMHLPDFSVGEIIGSFVSESDKNTVTFPLCKLMLEGVEYELDLEKVLTCKVLRQIKRWYPEIGNFVRFSVAIFQGDPEAMACIAWILWTNAGMENVPLPQNIDFAIGEVMNSYEFEELEEPEVEEPEPPAVIDLNTGEDKPMDPPLPSSGESS